MFAIYEEVVVHPQVPEVMHRCSDNNTECIHLWNFHMQRKAFQDYGCCLRHISCVNIIVIRVREIFPFYQMEKRLHSLTIQTPPLLWKNTWGFKIARAVDAWQSFAYRYHDFAPEGRKTPKVQSSS